MCPSLRASFRSPPLNLPQDVAVAIAGVVIQLPAMKLMAGPDLSAAREQSIPLRPKCPVADLKASPSGAESKHTSHGMGVTLQVGELASQHQHPAALGVDGMGGGEAP